MALTENSGGTVFISLHPGTACQGDGKHTERLGEVHLHCVLKLANRTSEKEKEMKSWSTWLEPEFIFHIRFSQV